MENRFIVRQQGFKLYGVYDQAYKCFLSLNGKPLYFQDEEECQIICNHLENSNLTF